jgi:mono/diheme cytochrome c family protein
VRAIRHGIGVDGKPLVFMPSHEYYYFNDDDLGKIIAYIKQVPPVDNEAPAPSPGPLFRFLFLTGELTMLAPAELIDHDAPRPSAVETGETLEFGEYLAVGCIGCHGDNYSGGPIPGMPPDTPPAANLTPDPATGLGDWTEEDFVVAMRQGKRPDGTTIDPFMPWPNFSQMTDEELGALWLYLQSLPARPYGNR